MIPSAAPSTSNYVRDTILLTDHLLFISTASMIHDGSHFSRGRDLIVRHIFSVPSCAFFTFRKGARLKRVSAVSTRLVADLTTATW
jgi:hypothetical protein